MSTRLRPTACVDVPELPLQMLLKSHPDWRDLPACVVSEDRPEAVLSHLNRHARKQYLRSGMRFGAAKSLVPELRAACVSAVEVEQMRSELVRGLQTFSPHVEIDPVSEGVFYLDPRGLAHLYGGALNWTRCVKRYLQGRGFYVAIVVGHGRALSFALARVTRGIRVIESEAEALALAKEVPIERLNIQPKLRDALERLGLTLLGDLANFGVDQLGLRLGPEAARLGRVAMGEEPLALSPEPHAVASRVEVEIEPPDADVARLCFAIKRGLDALMELLRQQGRALSALWLELRLERAPPLRQRIEPAAATRDVRVWLELLRLRLSSIVLCAQVSQVVLEAEVAPLESGQLAMFASGRDLAAGNRAIARLRASFGEDAVCRAAIEPEHFPEAQFRWQRVSRLQLPSETAQDAKAPLLPLVRRFFSTPSLINTAELAAHNVERGEAPGSAGPYPIQSHWWSEPASRDYYYLRSAEGVRWVFFDHARGAWFVQAVID